MLYVLQILALLLTVVVFVPAFAHALELPGKLHLDEASYRIVQAIYYPGFTIAGFCEPAAIVATAVLLVLLPTASMAFWLTLIALIGLLAMHAVYWLATHPVNRFWVEGAKLDRLGEGFFSIGSSRGSSSRGGGNTPDWTALRDRWEYSHIVRAGCAAVSLIALILSIGTEGTGA